MLATPAQSAPKLAANEPQDEPSITNKTGWTTTSTAVDVA